MIVCIQLQSENAKRKKKLRQSTAEPALGTLINFGGMRKVNTRGLAGATKFMIMAAVTYNIKKLLKHMAPIVQAAVVKLKKSVEGLEKGILKHFNAMARYNATYNRCLLTC